MLTAEIKNWLQSQTVNFSVFLNLIAFVEIFFWNGKGYLKDIWSQPGPRMRICNSLSLTFPHQEEHDKLHIDSSIERALKNVRVLGRQTN